MSKNIVVKRDETRVIHLLWTGKETELSYDITLAEPGACVEFRGLLVGHESNSLALDIKVTHAASNTDSNVVIKAALNGAAKADITCLTTVAPGAKGAKAWLAARILLLSSKAKGLAIPSLEILENDVKVGHATTVGQPSELELFYLMSRGLSRTDAKRLLVQGFFEDVIVVFPPALAKRAAKELAREPLEA